MTITVDWGAVLALTAIGTGILGLGRMIVRDEIRKVTNGKFSKIDMRLDELDVLKARLERSTSAGG